MAADPTSIPRLGQSWLKTLASLSVYTAVGASAGGLAAMLADYFGKNPAAWFLYGSAIPPGPLALLFASDWMMERKLKKLKDWRNRNLISATVYDRQVKAAMDWYSARWFGGGPGSPGRREPSDS